MSRRGERVQEIRGFKYIVTNGGKRISFYDAEREAKRGLTTLWRALGRMGKLAQKHEDYDWDWESIESLLDEVERMLRMWRKEVAEHGTRRDAEKRIALLRNIAGRTPQEASAYRAKADELERRLG